MSAVAFPQRPRRWLAAVLIASLAVNAFLFGALATDFLRIFGWRHGPPPPGQPPVSFELRWLQGRLPPDAFAAMERAVMAGRPDTLRHFDRLRELRAELGELVAKPEPDRAAIDAQLGEIRAELGRMQTAVQGRVMDALLSLPPETRAKLGDKTPAAP